MEYRYTPNRVCLIDANNQILAETTYPDVDEHTVNINHTWVDSSLRGQHVAERLLKIAAERKAAHNPELMEPNSGSPARFSTGQSMCRTLSGEMGPPRPCHRFGRPAVLAGVCLFPSQYSPL